ncbi:hypothetical protein SLEP1_g3225 [Rubroshorea leprosula]|uniref:RNase H type-1 domain-containing protein n=1 Tax=Rubroshorea leprosula TaxID=152421 RepID=A0AAV5HJN3_9ROSI|nr:hypothetical protein SLEP1_g3225 [Rubroshorea leprosula]
MQIKNKMEMRRPNPLQSPATSRDRTRYCDFHQDHGHTTEECKSLKSELESLARKGMLNEYIQNRSLPKFVKEQGQPQGSRASNNRDGVGYQQAPPPLPPPSRIIHMITGGPEVGGTSAKQQKLYVRDVRHHNAAQKRKIDEEDWKNQSVTFTSADLEGVVTPHNDPLVTSVIINNCEVQRALIDTGSAPDIMYYHCFESLGLDPALLQKYDGPIYGFNNQPVPVEAVLRLNVTFGSGRMYATPSVRFLVVKMASSFNLVIGRPTLTEIRAIVSQSHLCMKFPTPMGVATLRGNQEATRHCYMTSVARSRRNKEEVTSPESPHSEAPNTQQVMGVELPDNRPEDESRATPVEEVEEVQLDDNDPSKKTQIGMKLTPIEKEELVGFLKANKNVFAWTSADMPGIPTSVTVHKLSTNPLRKPVAQKRRLFGGERLTAIKEEVKKLLQAGFIRRVDYCEWIANPVMVKKSNGKWRMCIDYTNLNDACPKDCHPMPSIDKLVEAASGNERLSLLDAYSGYHQVRMAPEDEVKTSFYAGDEIYCYVMMSFGLKNAGATYQKMVTIVFRAQIGRNLEVYVDDIVVKSSRAEDHLTDLAETFNNLRRCSIKLNPAKCTFGVESGKFLGFMVSRRGIEVNPEKIKAIEEMKPPKSTKDVERLAGRVAALHRFISKSADKCLPFFKVLRTAAQKDETGKPQKFNWTTECQAAFDELKAYLSSPPLLTKAEEGEILYLYLGISDTVVSSVLVREMGKQQQPVYYASKVLQGAEQRYSIAEKAALAVVVTARKLRPYFQSHPIIVEPNSRAETWTLYVDGSSNNKGSGAGAVLTGPDSFQSEHALKFNFQATNNVAEYEALLLGLRLAAELKVKRLQIYSDSQLVVNQINSMCEVIDPILARANHTSAAELRANRTSALRRGCMTATIGTPSSDHLSVPEHPFSRNLLRQSAPRAFNAVAPPRGYGRATWVPCQAGQSLQGPFEEESTRSRNSRIFSNNIVLAEFWTNLGILQDHLKKNRLEAGTQGYSATTLAPSVGNEQKSSPEVKMVHTRATQRESPPEAKEEASPQASTPGHRVHRLQPPNISRQRELGNIIHNIPTPDNPADPLIHLLDPAPPVAPEPVQQPANSPVRSAAPNASQAQSHMLPQPQNPPQPAASDVSKRLDNLEKLLAENKNPQPQTPPVSTSIPTPLSIKITQEPYPPGFRMPQFETYDGTKDPDDHLHAFFSIMQAQNASDALMCKMFPSTLRSNARTWYHTLRPNSINAYAELATLFATKFSSRRLIKKTTPDLMRITQREGESLKNYMNRFNDAMLEVNAFDEAVGVTAMMQGLNHDRFRDNLIKNTPTTFDKVNQRSLKFIKAEEYVLSKPQPPKEARTPTWRDESQSRKKFKPTQNRGPIPVANSHANQE